MRYVSRTAVYQNARDLAGSAMQSSRRRQRLQRCRELLREIDPNKPPSAVHAREFDWQYRALRERVHLYSERLEAANDAEASSDYRLRKTELAVELSLRYFHDVLTPANQADGEEGGDNDA